MNNILALVLGGVGVFMFLRSSFADPFLTQIADIFRKLFNMPASAPEPQTVADRIQCLEQLVTWAEKHEKANLATQLRALSADMWE